MVITNVNTLVDAERGLISPRIFSEHDIYQEELQQIFARCWLFLCHEPRFPTPATSSPPTWARTRCWSPATVRARSTPS